MKVLIFGGGGREHALAWKIASSTRVSEIVCAPGNGGIAVWGQGSRVPCRCVPVDGTSLDSMLAVVMTEQPGLTVIGPEVPLALGLVDVLEQRGIRVFGPRKAAARLETSKAFAKNFMRAHGIPTAAYALCDSIEEITPALELFSSPIVVKADGLAAGKGVVICQTHAEAQHVAAEMFSGTLLGVPVRQVVLEEFLAGEELSFFALCDGKHAVPLAAAQDHKRIGEGDTGPNTGGMGAYSTATLMDDPLCEWLTQNVAQLVVDGMASAGTPFKGVLFCGIMLLPQTGGNLRPMVLEFNTRFGDPETQALLLRLDSDLVDLFDAAIDGTVDQVKVAMNPGASVCIIAASKGYPGPYEGGAPISGLVPHGTDSHTIVFHSGTQLAGQGLVSSGGRVLGVASIAPDLSSALQLAYGRIATISFEGMQYRRDIGWRALE